MHRQQAAIWLNGNEIAYDIALKYHNMQNQSGPTTADFHLNKTLMEMFPGDYNKVNHVTNYIKSLATVMRYRIEPIVNNAGIYMKDVQVAYIEEVEVDEWNTGTLYIRLNYPSRHQNNFDGRSYGA